MTTNTALRWTPEEGAHLVQEQVREPGPRDAVIAPLAVGLCGTDQHILAGKFPAAPGVVLGHEVCGRVLKVNDPASDLKPGDLVTVEPHRYCTQCFYCRAGDEHLCDQKKGYGVKLDGGLASYQVAPARILFKLPPDTAPTIGALTEPVACCLHGIDLLSPRSGESLLIQGCGPAGAIMVALARLAGLAPIVVSEPLAARRQLALDMGADAALDPADPDWPTRARELTAGVGFRHLVDAVGHASILESCIEQSARGARILAFGVAPREERAQISPRTLYDKELTILSSSINPYTHGRAVALLARLNLERLKSISFPLRNFEPAFEAQRQGTWDKVFLLPDAQAQ